MVTGPHHGRGGCIWLLGRVALDVPGIALGVEAGAQDWEADALICRDASMPQPPALQASATNTAPSADVQRNRVSKRATFAQYHNNRYHNTHCLGKKCSLRACMVPPWQHIPTHSQCLLAAPHAAPHAGFSTQQIATCKHKVCHLAGIADGAAHLYTSKARSFWPLRWQAVTSAEKE